MGTDLKDSRTANRGDTMRMMMQLYIPVEAGTAAIKDGSLANTFQHFMESAKPEAAYFVADGGERTAYFFFDLKSTTSSASAAAASPWPSR